MAYASPMNTPSTRMPKSGLVAGALTLLISAPALGLAPCPFPLPSLPDLGPTRLGGLPLLLLACSLVLARFLAPGWPLLCAEGLPARGWY